MTTKILTGIGAAMLSAAVFATDGSVSSQNVVGYATKECKAGQWYMIGCGFEDVGGKSLKLQNFVTGLEAHDNPAFIQYWDGTRLVTYYYKNIIVDWETWEEAPRWVDSEENEVDLTMNPGAACWFKDNAKDVNITVAGQVASTSDKEVTLSADGWHMIANPYPVSTTLNGGLVDWSGLPVDNDNPVIIQTWNGAKLVTYSYKNIIVDWETWEEAPRWVDSEENEVVYEIPVQTGFWIKSKTGGKVLWKKSK